MLLLHCAREASANYLQPCWPRATFKQRELTLSNKLSPKTQPNLEEAKHKTWQPSKFFKKQMTVFQLQAYLQSFSYLAQSS
jgi:hypothetical protein